MPYWIGVTLPKGVRATVSEEDGGAFFTQVNILQMSREDMNVVATTLESATRILRDLYQREVEAGRDE